MGKRSTYDWQFHIRQQKASGLTVKEYSQKQGFTAWSFYMNRKRLIFALLCGLLPQCGSGYRH